MAAKKSLAIALPVISPEASRLKSVPGGIDYSNPLPVSYTGHELELNAREMAQLKEYAKKLEADKAYHDACMEKGGGIYASDVRLMPISEAAKLPPASFNKPYEFEAVKQLEKDLKQKALQNRRE